MTAGSAYSAPGASPSATTSAPALVTPPAGGYYAPVNWGTANRARFARFQLVVPTTLRYFLIKAGTAAGNVQFGVVRLSGVNRLDFTRVMNSGVVAHPGTGDIRYSLGATDLVAGDYAAFVLASDTTAQFPLGTSQGYSSARLFTTLNPGAGGVPASGTLDAWGTDFALSLAAWALEGDV